MASKAEKQEALRRWREHCDNIQRMTIVPVESEAERLRRIERARRDYAFFVSWYFPIFFPKINRERRHKWTRRKQDNF